MSRTRPERRGYDKLNFEQHLERLSNMKATVDCAPPHQSPWTNRLEMEKRRHQAVVEFENKLMLERLAKIVQHKSIDNEIHHSIAMHQKFKKKLGLTKKRLTMQKLTEENQNLLKRIQEVPPAYDHFQWEEEAQRHDHIKRCMALYPEYYDKLEKEKEEKKIRKLQSKSASSLPPISPPAKQKH